MLVVKVYLWPLGDASRARLLSQASISLLGQAGRDDPERGIRKGERAYRVRIFKDTDYRGPEDGVDVREVPSSKVWREGHVRGHLPGRRGVWDLLGGALQAVIGGRLGDYVGFKPDLPAPEPAQDPEIKKKKKKGKKKKKRKKGDKQ